MIHCPHCSRSIESHDGKPCPRRFSRRFFFGLLAGVGVAVAKPPETLMQRSMREYMASPPLLGIRYILTPLSYRITAEEIRAEAQYWLNQPPPAWAGIVGLEKP